MTKRECAVLEYLFQSMSQLEYDSVLGWLAGGSKGSLWKEHQLWQRAARGEAIEREDMAA
jgi:hypothetical protein